MKHLILVRHGQPDVPTSGYTGNPPLTPRGHEQARYAAAALRKESIHRIFSSGMARADETAAPLAQALGLSVETHPGLGEIDRWGGEYVSIDAIRHRGADDWKAFLADPFTYLGVDGDRFRSETLAAFHDVVNSPGEETIAVFSHGFPINILLSHVLGLNNDARFVPSYASFSRLAGRKLDALTVISVNESGHIPEVLK